LVNLFEALFRSVSLYQVKFGWVRLSSVKVRKGGSVKLMSAPLKSFCQVHSRSHCARVTKVTSTQQRTEGRENVGEETASSVS